MGYGQSVWPPQLVLLTELAQHSPARLAIFNLPNTKITAGLPQSFFQGKGGRAGFGAGPGRCSGCVWWVPHLCPLSIPSLATAALRLPSGPFTRDVGPCSSAKTCCEQVLCFLKLRVEKETNQGCHCFCWELCSHEGRDVMGAGGAPQHFWVSAGDLPQWPTVRK